MKLKNFFLIFILGCLFLSFIWYLQQSGNCQIKAKFYQTYVNNETELKCLNPKNWK